MEEAKPKSPFVKTFSCPNCAGSVNIRAIGSSINVVCTYCSSIIDTNDENYKVVDAFTNKIKRRQVISLGQRGKLFDTLWENIGYMERSDKSGLYTWSEYLLFNPFKGFRWLTEYNGHWSFVKTIKDIPKVYPKKNPVGATFHNKSHQLFNRGTATVNFVIGEFYWQVRIGETVDLLEFINPPILLSVERNKEETIWSTGEYVSAETIRTAFEIKDPMPSQSGIAPNQPSPLGQETTSKILKFWKYFSIALVLLQMGFCLGSSRKTVYKSHFEFNSEDKEKTKVTPQFEIKDRSTNLNIRFLSEITNSWLEINTDLVNDDTGETVEFTEGIEFYTGIDSDGTWKEGSKSTTKTLPGISKGKYHLNLEVSGPMLTKTTGPVKDDCPECLKLPDLSNILNKSPGKSVTLLVEVKTGATLWSNFFFAIILLSFYPMYIFWKRRRFEITRWSESDFSPYYSGDED